MKILLLLFTALLALQAASSDEGAPTTRSKNYNGHGRELTSQDDLDGLYVLTSSFESLHGYTGDPCAVFGWTWILCSYYPTRVAFLFLSDYSLSGNLPDFSKLDGLVSIYMSDNELNGTIPDFIGKLPLLKKLDLSNNNFSGEVPKSIANNLNLYLNVDGNPNLKLTRPDHQPKNMSQPKSKKGLIVGLVIGIPVVIIFAVLGIAFIVYLKRSQKLQLQLQQQQQQQQQTTTGSDGLSSIDIGGNAPTAPVSYGNTNQAGAANAIAAQNTDDDEIAELLRQRSRQTGS